MRHWPLLLLVSLLACGEAPPEYFCDQSEYEDCFNGAFFSDCGGNRAPVFACSEDRGCRWFSDGCPASGFVASPCSADNICCMGGGPFLYEGPPDPINMPRPNIRGAFYGWGTDPWDREREVNVTVALDPTVKGDAPFVCAGDYPYPESPSPCGSPDPGPGTWLDDTLRLSFGPGMPAFGGWTLMVEIIPQEDGAFGARGCVHRFTDVGGIACPGREVPIYCANAGTLTISEWPGSEAEADTVTGTFSLEFDAFSITGSF